MVLLPGLAAGEIVVWFLAGDHRGCGQSSVIIDGLAIVHLYIQSLMANQYLLNE